MRKLATIISIVTSISFVSAQNSDSTLTFVSPYVPKIEKADKIADNPRILDTIQTKTDINYEVISRHVNTDFKPKSIPPVKLKLNPPIEKLQKHYASLGLGANGFPEVAYGFNSGRSGDQAFGLMLKHYSAKTTIDGYALNNMFMNNYLDIVYKKFVNSYTFSGNIDYSFDAYNLYGEANSELHSDLAVLKQNYCLGKANFAYHTGFKDSAVVNHHAALEYQNLFDKDMNMEHGIFVSGGIRKYLDKGLLNVNISEQHFINTDTSGTSDWGNVFNITPTHTWKNDNYEVLVGFVFTGGLSQLESKVSFAPRVKGQYAIVKELLNVYADVDGGYRRSGYQYLSSINPFMNSLSERENTRVVYDARFGFRGSLSKTMSFNTGFRMNSIKVDALFVNDTITGNSNQFTVVYDNIDQTQFYGELSHEGKKWDNILQGEYNIYSTENELTAWHRPDFKFTYSIDYNIQDLVGIGMDAYFIGNRQAIGYSEGVYKQLELDPYFDLNLEVTYNYSKFFQAYGKVFNLMNNNYQYWNNYPVQGMNFLIGANYRF